MVSLSNDSSNRLIMIQDFSQEPSEARKNQKKLENGFLWRNFLSLFPMTWCELVTFLWYIHESTESGWKQRAIKSLNTW